MPWPLAPASSPSPTFAGSAVRGGDRRNRVRSSRPCLSALRRDAWIDGIGPATRLDIQVPQPAITHTVTVLQLERRANGSAVIRRANQEGSIEAILTGTGG